MKGPDLRTTVLALLERASALPLLTGDDNWPEVAAARDKLRDRFLLVAVCGEFSSGKSTVTGAILRRPDLFPVDVGASTSVPTIVRWDEHERVEVITKDRPDGFVVKPAELSGYVTEAGNPKNARQVYEVRVGLPHPLLETGIGLVDLPGTGSANPLHAVATNRFLELIDAALFVNGAAVTDSEIGFLARVAARVGPELVLVRNKIDLPATDGGGPAAVERALTDLRQKAAAELGRPAGDLVVLPVSARQFLYARDEDDEVTSGVPVLVDTLETQIAARAETVLSVAAVDALQILLEEVRERTRTRLVALRNGETTEIAEVRAALAEREARLAEVKATETTWRGKLNGSMRSIATDHVVLLRSGLDRISTEAHAALADDSAASSVDANSFTADLINRVHDLYTEVSGDLESAANAEVAHLTEDLGAPLDRLSARTAFTRTKALDFREPERKKLVGGQRYIEAGSKAARKTGFARMVGTFGGMGLGACLGLVAAPLTGGLSLALAVTYGAIGGAVSGGAIATAVGTGMVMQQELAALDAVAPAERRAKLREHVKQALKPNLEQANQRMNDVVVQLQTQAAALVAGAVESARQSVEQQRAELTQDLQRGRAEALAEATGLETVDAVMDQLEREAATARQAAPESDSVVDLDGSRPLDPAGFD